MITQVVIFDDHEQNPVKVMNEFIKDKNVIDIKMNTVCGLRGSFFTRYMVIYTT